MKVAETRPDTERQQLISSVTADAAHLLNINLTEDPPKEVMNKVNDAIVALVFEQPTPITNDENPHLLLGCLWGAQMARQFNWYWADVVLDDSIDEVAMISPNREMIIFPFSFVDACINKQCISTVLLAYNMVDEGKMNAIKPATYENIMLSIHHIVPPYTLTPAN